MPMPPPLSDFSLYYFPSFAFFLSSFSSFFTLDAAAFADAAFALIDVDAICQIRRFRFFFFFRCHAILSPLFFLLRDIMRASLCCAFMMFECYAMPLILMAICDAYASITLRAAHTFHVDAASHDTPPLAAFVAFAHYRWLSPRHHRHDFATLFCHFRCYI